MGKLTHGYIFPIKIDLKMLEFLFLIIINDHSWKNDTFISKELNFQKNVKSLQLLMVHGSLNQNMMEKLCPEALNQKCTSAM